MTDRPYYITCKKCGLTLNTSNYSRKFCNSCLEIGYNRTYYRNKKIALQRDDNKCQCCKTKKDLLAHHIDCFKSNNSITNLIILCSQCHHHLHSKYTREELRRSNIYKLFPKKITHGLFGKRFNKPVFNNVIFNSKFIKKRFYRNKKSL